MFKYGLLFALLMKGRKERRKWGLIVFIIIIMVGTTFSFVFYGFQPQSDVVNYNELKFVRYADRWEAKISGRQAAFSYLPGEVESVLALDGSLKRLKGALEIDVTSDFNSTYKEAIALAQHQMELTLAQYNIFVRKGFTSNNPFNAPVITCGNSTLHVPVIYFTHGNATNMHVEKECIIAESNSDEGFIKVKDRLLYAVLGVME